MTRKRIGLLAGVAAIAAVGIGVGVAVATSGPTGRPAAVGPGYSWYQSMMSRNHGGSMMGGSPNGWMMSRHGYQ
jgi:hypothetical protein